MDGGLLESVLPQGRFLAIVRPTKTGSGTIHEHEAIHIYPAVRLSGV
jgi:hypothetical protein